MGTQREETDEGHLGNYLPQDAMFFPNLFTLVLILFIADGVGLEGKPCYPPSSLEGEQLRASFRQTTDTVVFDLRRSVVCLFFLLEGKKFHYHSISRGKWENPAGQIGALQKMPLKSLCTEITFPFKPVKKVWRCLTCSDVSSFLGFPSFLIHMGAKGACVFLNPHNPP